MNTRHPVNPALKKEGGARTAHGLRGRSCDACVSSLAGGSRENPGQRDGRRRTVEGRKQAPWRQSTKGAAEPGEDQRVCGGAGGETPGGSLPLTYPRGETPGGGTPGGSTPGGGSLLLTPPQRRDTRRRDTLRIDTRRRLPPAHPTPEGAHGPGAGSHPLPSLRLCASGWSREHTSCFT